MAARKAVEKKSHAEEQWELNDKKYPRKKGICTVCKQKDDLKLAYDLRNYICINVHACLLRFAKLNAERTKV